MISQIKVNLPGFRSPAVGCDEPFEMLIACHERVQRMLDLLDRARMHALTKGCDADLNSAFTDVMRYFDLAANQRIIDGVKVKSVTHESLLVAQISQERKYKDDQSILKKALLIYR